eukprot:TRINITY_DN3794_c0_g2_i3.p2 TRINITY_DN3794_c0_g2~~TRINITY_DN3794_c0_g2_i3.p2  ORF type:complete len:114 (-),score=23.80 TRINITY_DN3794_c0_g2_i3:482-775(-)
MCIRDRYQRRVHGDINHKLITVSQSIRRIESLYRTGESSLGDRTCSCFFANKMKGPQSNVNGDHAHPSYRACLITIPRKDADCRSINESTGKETTLT